MARPDSGLQAGTAFLSGVAMLCSVACSWPYPNPSGSRLAHGLSADECHGSVTVSRAFPVAHRRHGSTPQMGLLGFECFPDSWLLYALTSPLVNWEKYNVAPWGHAGQACGLGVPTRPAVVSSAGKCRVDRAPRQSTWQFMVAVPSNGFHQSLWRSNCLSPREEQELDFDHLGEGLVEVSSGDGPPWEAELVSRIRALSATEKSLVLETVSHYLEERGQGAGKEQVWGTEDVAIRELLEPWHLVPQQTLEQTFLFHLSGLVLRECDDTELVKSHLAHLLELPHQPCSQREGIALAVGLTSASHLEDVWAALEHLGRTRFLRSALCLADGQQPDSDLHWKWVSSTVLLCYGQVALHAREQVLPWVDSLASRMVYYFSCSSYDSALKTSFLAAAVMLVKALRREAGTQSYKFMQTPELIRCLLCILQREPNFLATPFRQKIILVIVGLSNLRPCLKPTVKSTILQTCLKSLYTLPPLELPDSSLPPQDPAPDVMVTPAPGQAPTQRGVGSGTSPGSALPCVVGKG
ncbi:HEAT repeat-containing protein 7A [Tupaia chinensis]|uniref:HEAT repeat-containing protein 7A n=1 Tax=Tupaia chinensis TaxID=246437 RepID=L9KKF5_TUPCH|nr:HEAT repeat-containing protein 7A [Tupaia chinensis]